MADHSKTPLGKMTQYVSQYDPSLLYPIERAGNRESLGITSELPFTGKDLWTAFEVSWLNPKGVPQVRLAEFSFDCASASMVESKSFKLYLNSFNQTQVDNENSLQQILAEDLSRATGAEVDVKLKRLSDPSLQTQTQLVGQCIDELAVEVEHYHPQSSLLKVNQASVATSEILYSHLLKSNCPVTNQPDWATVWVEYSGPQIIPESLLAYIISFREHQDFHEHCVERIFCDILKQCQPQALTVYARYTRRGGLDINPLRTNMAAGESRLMEGNWRTLRQ